ncbi:MAG TPA: bifunctional hydroxymethylpyrimidine kinase/phosphomethylpyrimidine kinase [Beutenbergiaceae bacterium]|nr:bifunctional hydroxymethylpyrimidine kinase/phosphomethylpyrimidine kinase [Beutenbergiaceae bacterium]
MTIPRVLSIAGSDPSGGAGIQADLKSIAANGGYGMAAITALTAQNTHGVRQVHVPPAQFLGAQLDTLAQDVEIDAVKIGMLGGAATVEAVASWLGRTPVPFVVLDPVMVASSGDRLLDLEAEQWLSDLMPRADLVTPNITELAVLAEIAAPHETGSSGEGARSWAPAQDWDEAQAQARVVATRFGVVVLAKGGHLPAEMATDVLVRPDGRASTVSAPWVRTNSTHGTGCALSSAIACHVAANGGDWEAAVRNAKDWLTAALEGAERLEVGSGHGPLHHFASVSGEPTRAR